MLSFLFIDRTSETKKKQEKIIISNFFVSYFAGKDIQIRSPDSPESARAIAPKSPISPKNHSNSLAPPRSNCNDSSSPILKGSTTPPLSAPAAPSHATTPTLLTEQTREINKLRKFLGALYQFGQDSGSECGERIRSLILSLAVSVTYN